MLLSIFHSNERKSLNNRVELIALCVCSIYSVVGRLVVGGISFNQFSNIYLCVQFIGNISI